MFISRCHSGFASYRFLLLFVSLALVGLGFSATAQTAPQILPYTVKLIAGSGAAAIAKGATCPLSGLISTDAYGDGCLATEILIAPTPTAGTGARFAVADSSGAVFFSDATNGLIRRVDPITHIVTTVAGGATSSPASGTACGANVSTDSDGDGCLGTAVKLGKPMGLAFSPAGDLYFADNSFDDIRKIAATGGVIATTGIITNIAGGSTFGYNVNNAAGPVNAATQSLLNFPYGIAFDTAGNLYVADEGNNAMEVINLTAATETIQGLTVPAGTMAKFAGYGNLNTKTASNTECPVFTAAVTGSRGGCYFGKWVDGSAAATSFNDAIYSLAVDPAGNVYFGNEFNSNIGLITAANIISDYAGIQGTALKDITKRAVAGSFGIGSSFGVAVDALKNLYVADASSGVIWRVDSAGHSMYVLAGGATTLCSATTDTWGDGCPAPQSKFGSSGTGLFASTTLPGPGIFGISVDAYSDLFTGDTENGLIREIASGTQFGKVGVNPPTQIVDIHFAAGDSPAASAYTLTAGATNFSLGSATCTSNSGDLTVDCLLPVTAKPTGVSTGSAFNGTLQVVSTLGGKATFQLSGTYFGTPATTTSVIVVASCAGTTIYLPTTLVTLTANIGSSGSPTGTVAFFANGTQIGTPQAVSNGSATLAYAFPTLGAYTITATYSGDSYFISSSGKASAQVSSQTPNFQMTTVSYPAGTVSAGGTALFSFNLVQNVYAGTIAFSVAGLPANSTFATSPSGVSSTACSAGSTIALSILTQQGTVLPASIGAAGGGWCSTLSILSGVGLALLIGLRRRSAARRYGRIWIVLGLLMAASGLVACNNIQNAASTPPGSYTLTVTATGSSGYTSTLSLPAFTVK